MKIQIPQEFYTLTENKTLLLDTNILFDALKFPQEFAELFNKFKNNQTAITTIKPVLFEFTKGSPNIATIEERIAFVTKLSDSFLPLSDDIFDSVDVLIKKYLAKGSSLSVVDLLLCACTMKYNSSLYLLTRDTTDISNKIFNFVSHIHLVHEKGIHLIALYEYSSTDVDEDVSF